MYYGEEFIQGDVTFGAYVCELTLTDPDGFTMQAGGPGTFVMPAARDHGGPAQAIGAGSAGPPSPAAAWAAARARALGPERVAALYAAYVAGKKKGVPRTQAAWWGVPGQRGGARNTVEGCLGEYQADQLFAAQGHTKLNHGGQLVGLLDPPRGPGIDGVWHSASPPPTYFITETKYGKPPKLSKGQMSDRWIGDQNRLPRALGRKQAEEIQEAMLNGQVGKRLLHVDAKGQLTTLGIDHAGKTFTI